MSIKTFVVIEKDNRYLVIQEASEKWRGKWFVPGGNVKKGESPEKAAEREVREEAGCEIQLGGIFYIKYYTGFFTRKIHLFYSAKMIGTKIKDYENKHSICAKWVTYDELKKMSLRSKLFEILDAFQKSKQHLLTENFKIIQL